MLTYLVKISNKMGVFNVAQSELLPYLQNPYLMWCKEHDGNGNFKKLSARRLADLKTMLENDKAK